MRVDSTAGTAKCHKSKRSIGAEFIYYLSNRTYLGPRIHGLPSGFTNPKRAASKVASAREVIFNFWYMVFI